MYRARQGDGQKQGRGAPRNTCQAAVQLDAVAGCARRPWSSAVQSRSETPERQRFKRDRRVVPREYLNVRKTACSDIVNDKEFGRESILTGI